MNTQLKVINRPFKEVENFTKRTKRIIFKLLQSEEGVAIMAVNNTPYYFTPGQMSIQIGENKYQVYLDMEKTVAPFSEKCFSLTTHIQSFPAGRAKLNFTAIDDIGTLKSFTYTLRND